MKEAGIPLYLRFDVKLSYMDSDEGTIAERFPWVQMILQPFNQELTESKCEFRAKICNRCGKSDFKDSSLLLDQIDKLLQIFARCRAYNFYIESHINELQLTSTPVLAAILQFDAIVRCSKITVEFNFGSFTPSHLPIEAIGNWLNCTNGQEHNERFLSLKIHDDVPNLGEMFEHLKKVCHFLFAN